MITHYNATLNSANALPEGALASDAMKKAMQSKTVVSSAKQCNAVQCDDVYAVLYVVVWPQRVDSRHRMSDLQ